MSRGQKIGRISRDVRNLVRDRLKESIDDNRFKQGLSTIVDANKGIGNLYSDIGEALAKWVVNYLYLITHDINTRIAQGAEANWSIVMSWAQGNLANDPVRKLFHSRLESADNRSVFEQQVGSLVSEHKDTPGFIEKLRAEVTGAVLDYFFKLADQVDDRILQDFKKYYVATMSK